MACKTVADFARADSGPEAIIVRSPVAALDGPPETGASTRVRPLLRLSSWTCRARAAEGATVDESMIVELVGSAISSAGCRLSPGRLTRSNTSVACKEDYLCLSSSIGDQYNDLCIRGFLDDIARCLSSRLGVCVHGR